MAWSYWTGRKKGSKTLLDDLMLYWKFDNSYNDEIETLTPVSTTNTSFSTGIINQGVLSSSGPDLYYNGSMGNSFSDSATDNFSDVPFSISLWVNISSVSSSGGWIVSKRPESQSGADEWQLRLSSSRILAIVCFVAGSAATNSIVCETNNALSTSTWIHVVATYDGSHTVNGLKIYLDGVEQAVTRTTNGTYTGMLARVNVFRFFRLFNNNNTSLIGTIDEVGMWRNRELNQLEIDQLYNSGNGLQYPFSI
jgi:hypothetical protein